MKKGDKITSVLPAANYDPTVFDNPREINFKRPRKPMLAFAGGVHSCMGAHLARLEMRICISEFLRRIPNFQLKEGFKVERSEEHTSELQSLMRISYAVFCLTKKNINITITKILL